jgi:hypothetical protein
VYFYRLYFLKVCVFVLQKYETRLLPHECDQIVVSILLTNLSSSHIKELVFSMCDTPAVRLLRAVCNFIHLLNYVQQICYAQFTIKSKLHILMASFVFLP